MAKKRTEDLEKVLDINAAIQGTMVFKDPVNLRINGDFTGQLDTKGFLSIGENANIKANISGDNITVAGVVRGNITALESLTIIAPAHIVGDIRTPALSVSDGAVINGRIAMTGEIQVTPDYLTVREVARYLEVEDAVLIEWAKSNKIPAVFENNEWKFKRDEVNAWVLKEKINV
jgi:excisionase family DNA binding protein